MITFLCAPNTTSTHPTSNIGVLLRQELFLRRFVGRHGENTAEHTVELYRGGLEAEGSQRGDVR